jgi:hypothetical protein
LHSLSLLMMKPLEELSAQLFREQLKTRFNVHPDGGAAIALELIEVEEKGSGTIELFLLRFAGPLTPRLAQQVHRLEHGKIGEFEIFITPISAGQEQGTVYEAVFHRFRKK